MEVIDPAEIMKGFRRVDLRAARADKLRGALDDIRCVRARLDRIEAEIARRLETVTGTPERDVAKGAQRSNRHGAKVMARAATLANTPELSDALDAGDLGGDHVDVFAKVLGALDGPVKARLAEAAPELIEQAARSGSTPEEFAASLNAAAEQITADGGLSRLDRQRRATRLRTWTDRATGMWRLSGSFDPESGARIHGRLEAAMAAMFAAKTPSTAPTDPGEKQDHLRALALLALTKGVVGSKAPPAGSKAPPAGSKAQPAGPSGPEPTHDGTTDQPTSPDEWDEFAAEVGTASTRFGRPECVFEIDTTNLGPDGKPTVDWGIPVTIPWARVQDLCANATIRPVIVRDGAVIDANGELNLGRTTRLANRAQRRALRAVYATCAVPGCNVAFNHTKPHHVHWWRHGGPTDFANLLPLCSKHHHAVHEGGWLLTLGPDRELTIETPAGQIMRTGPPSRRPAAA